MSVTDLLELHNNIVAKLRRYKTALQFSAVLEFRERKIHKFSSWPNFENFPWGIPEETESLVLKWQFLIQFENADSPSIHSVTVHLTTPPNVMGLMQHLLSGRAEDLHEADVKAAEMSARVDFVDNILGRELLSIVTEWHESRGKPSPVFPIFEKIHRHAGRVRGFIRHSVPSLVFIAALAIFFDGTLEESNGSPASTEFLREIVFWIAGIVAAVFLASHVARWIARIVERSILGHGVMTPFELTRGDNNRQTRYLARKRNSIYKGLASTVLALVINLAAALIGAKFFFG
ncbi:MAG: hypothetical protein IIB66_09370 [Proteobacteria bacterium]|nr:hypothetical protein [Pseudomonadota bacterium]